MLILKIKNISGTWGIADYRWEVFENDKVIAEGFTRHNRLEGYAALLEKIAKYMREHGNPKPEEK